MIDLSTWNLTIPQGTPALTIATPTLVKGFKDSYFHSDTGTLFFWAPVTGSTSTGSDYPRSELRETNPDGSLRNWLYSAADNEMKATLMVNQVPSVGKVVIGQIHVFQGSAPMLKLEYQYKDKTGDGNIVAKLRVLPTDADGTVITLATGIKLNTRFAYSLHLTKAGELAINVADKIYTTRLNSKWANTQFYYKAGAYISDNTGYASEGGMVTFYSLAVTHTK